jgi:hypothetical protein
MPADGMSAAAKNIRLLSCRTSDEEKSLMLSRTLMPRGRGSVELPRRKMALVSV